MSLDDLAKKIFAVGREVTERRRKREARKRELVAMRILAMEAKTACWLAYNADSLREKERALWSAKDKSFALQQKIMLWEPDPP